MMFSSRYGRAAPASGKSKYITPTGGANITEATKTGSIDGIVETSWSMTVNGSMTAVTAT